MALTCQELIAILGDYHSGSLAVDLAVLAELHLLGCLECADYLQSYKETIRLSKFAFEFPDDGVPDEVVRAILRRQRETRDRDMSLSLPIPHL